MAENVSLSLSFHTVQLLAPQMPGGPSAGILECRLKPSMLFFTLDFSQWG
jgi:hypothetical protein